MLEADLDGNGTIEFPEFLELMKEKYGSDDQESDLRSDLISLRCSDTNLREAFKIFDRDRDGFIDMRELKKVSLIPVQGCISCDILVSGIRAHGVSSEHMENIEMFSCSRT